MSNHHPSLDEPLTPDRVIRWYEGKREGIRLYAWWKDGEQFVGTSGRTLRTALWEINQEEDEAMRQSGFEPRTH